MERYQDLLNADISATLPPFRPPPPILQEWRIDTSKGIVSGQIDNGSTIWFPSQFMGRLPEDPATSMGDETSTFAGGFVEAVGGRVFEMGRARPTDPVVAMGFTEQSNVRVYNTDKLEKRPGEEKLSWSTTIAASIATVVAASLLSVVIGFGVGSNAGSLSPTTSPPPLAKTAASTERTLYRMGSNLEPTVSEKRARMEVKVLQEKRIIQAAGTRLSNDEIRLTELRLQEASEVQQNMVIDATE